MATKAIDSNKTRQNKKRLIEAMKKSLGVVTQACKKVGVDRTTYYTYYNNDPEFRKACDECEDIALDFAESQLMQQIQSKNTVATIFYLKTKGKKRGYVERQEITGKDGGSLDVNITIDI